MHVMSIPCHNASLWLLPKYAKLGRRRWIYEKGFPSLYSYVRLESWSATYNLSLPSSSRQFLWLALYILVDCLCRDLKLRHWQERRCWGRWANCDNISYASYIEVDAEAPNSLELGSLTFECLWEWRLHRKWDSSGFARYPSRALRWRKRLGGTSD